MGNAGWPSDAGSGHNGWALEPRAGAKTTGQRRAGWKGSRKINCSEETARANSSAPAERHAKAGPETAARSRGAEPLQGSAPRSRHETANPGQGEKRGQRSGSGLSHGGLDPLGPDFSWTCCLQMCSRDAGAPCCYGERGKPRKGSLSSPLREGLAASADPYQSHDETRGGIRWSLQKWRDRRSYLEVTKREMPGGGRSGWRPALRDPARLSPVLRAHAQQPGTRSGAENKSEGQPAFPPAHGEQRCVCVTSPGGSRSLPWAPPAPASPGQQRLCSELLAARSPGT